MEAVRIKKGRCVFSTERLMLEEAFSGYVSNFLDMWREGGTGEKSAFVLSVFMVFFSLSFVASFLLRASFRQISYFTGALVFLMLGFWLHQWRNGFTADRFIRKEDIESVRFVEGRRWITCPRFILEYEEDGESRKRYVIMPSHLIPGVEDDVEELKERFEGIDADTDW